MLSVLARKQNSIALCQSVIACASSKIERWIEDAKKFLTGVVPQIVVNDQITDFVAFDLKFVPQERDKMAILQLPELLAKEKGIGLLCA